MKHLPGEAMQGFTELKLWTESWMACDYPKALNWEQLQIPGLLKVNGGMVSEATRK